MQPEQFHPDQFARGAKYTLDLEFSAAGHDLRLPVLLVRGAAPGKRLVVTAGVHGDEYEGVHTILELYQELDLARMAGDLLAVPAANPPAFWNLSRSSPLDGGNLARVFPGDPAGSPTAAIAYHLDQRILAHADLYIDLHSAGVRCLMPTLIGYHEPDQRAREAAMIFGAPVIWCHPSVAPGRTVSSAIARGIPALYTEARGAGRIHPDDLAVYRRGVRNLLRHLHILEGAPDAPACQCHLHGDGNIDQSVSSTQSGFLVASVELLEPVRRGQQLGVLLDLHAQPVERFQAPCDGLVALIHACPMVHPGEPLFLVTGLAKPEP
jgi:N2-acetyl-L-2,4-diaminobutanoate deacetylase